MKRNALSILNGFKNLKNSTFNEILKGVIDPSKVNNEKFDIFSQRQVKKYLDNILENNIGLAKEIQKSVVEETKSELGKLIPVNIKKGDKISKFFIAKKGDCVELLKAVEPVNNKEDYFENNDEFDEEEILNYIRDNQPDDDKLINEFGDGIIDFINKLHEDGKIDVSDDGFYLLRESSDEEVDNGDDKDNNEGEDKGDEENQEGDDEGNEEEGDKGNEEGNDNGLQEEENNEGDEDNNNEGDDLQEGGEEGNEGDNNGKGEEGDGNISSEGMGLNGEELNLDDEGSQGGQEGEENNNEGDDLQGGDGDNNVEDGNNGDNINNNEGGDEGTINNDTQENNNGDGGLQGEENGEGIVDNNVDEGGDEEGDNNFNGDLNNDDNKKYTPEELEKFAKQTATATLIKFYKNSGDEDLKDVVAIELKTRGIDIASESSDENNDLPNNKAELDELEDWIKNYLSSYDKEDLVQFVADLANQSPAKRKELKEAYRKYYSSSNNGNQALKVDEKDFKDFLENHYFNNFTDGDLQSMAFLLISKNPKEYKKFKSMYEEEQNPLI